VGRSLVLETGAGGLTLATFFSQLCVTTWRSSGRVRAWAPMHTSMHSQVCACPASTCVCLALLCVSTFKTPARLACCSLRL
jgi:hypothetical protein